MRYLDTDTIHGGSSIRDVLTDSGNSYMLSTSTRNAIVNGTVGTYSQGETDTSSSSESDSSSDNSTDYLAWGGGMMGGGGGGGTSTDSDVSTDNSTDTDSGNDTDTLTGSVVTDVYTEQETSTDAAMDSDGSTDTPTDTLEGGTTNSGTQTDNTSENVGSTDTITSSGNNISGSYSQQDIGSESGTEGETTGDNDSWSGDSVALGTGGNAETDTTAVEMNTTDIETGNDNTEAYTLTEYGFSDPTVTDTSVEQGLAGTSTDAQSETWTTTESGNYATGVDDSTTTDTTAASW